MFWGSTPMPACASAQRPARIAEKTSPQLRGKQLISQGRAPETYVLRATREEIVVLKETDPVTFWQTPQYEGWPTVLVNAAHADPDRVKLLISRAWWDRATLSQRRAYGDRP